MRVIKAKVYSVRTHRPGHRVEGLALVATTSYVRAAVAIGCTVGYLRTYGSITENEADVALAKASPGELVWSEKP